MQKFFDGYRAIYSCTVKNLKSAQFQYLVSWTSWGALQSSLSPVLPFAKSIRQEVLHSAMGVVSTYGLKDPVWVDIFIGIVVRNKLYFGMPSNAKRWEFDPPSTPVPVVPSDTHKVIYAKFA